MKQPSIASEFTEEQLATELGARLAEARAMWQGIELRAHPITLYVEGPIVWLMPDGSAMDTRELLELGRFSVVVPFRKDLDETPEYFAAHAREPSSLFRSTKPRNGDDTEF